MRVVMGGLTHPGQVRGENEDCIITRSELGLAVLADGMGGHQAGEVASRMAVDIITAYFAESPGGRSSRKSAVKPQALVDAIRKANTAVYEAAQARPDYRGMGSTVVVAMFAGNRLCVGHVGDSRLYRFRNGALEQLTKDHSVVQELINRGLYTPEEARQSTAKNLVTRALGVEPVIEPDTASTAVQPGDIFLLCSDGLTDVVTDEQIADVLRRHDGDVDAAAKQLVDRANAQGGPDNISVVLVQARDDSNTSQDSG